MTTTDLRNIQMIDINVTLARAITAIIHRQWIDANRLATPMERATIDTLEEFIIKHTDERIERIDPDPEYDNLLSQSKPPAPSVHPFAAQPLNTQTIDVSEVASVELVIDQTNKVWLNVNGVCVFRAGVVNEVILDDCGKVTVLRVAPSERI